MYLPRLWPHIGFAPELNSHQKIGQLDACARSDIPKPDDTVTAAKLSEQRCLISNLLPAINDAHTKESGKWFCGDAMHQRHSKRRPHPIPLDGRHHDLRLGILWQW